MFQSHRGKVIYVPIVVPENIALGLAHLCGVTAFVLLVMAAASSSWHVVHILDKPLSSFDRQITAKLTFGLRSFHVSYCEDYKCTFEDMYYSSCSENSMWCIAHADLQFSYVLLIGAGIGLLVSSLSALSKAALLPTGYFLCAWASILAILSYRQRRHSFVPSDMLAAWIDNGNTTTELASGYYAAIAAVGTVGLGVILATTGYHQLAMSAPAETPVAQPRAHHGPPTAGRVPEGSQS
jgi:hypothetical protein